MRALTKPIDIAILVYFRLFAGLLISWELVNSLLLGEFETYTVPKFHFSPIAFITPWASSWAMALHFGVTIMAGVFVGLGIKYRAAAVTLFLGYSSIFLMDFAEYNNHMYLYSLLSFWLIWLPLGSGELKEKAPAWMLYLILFHMSLAYFFGGVAKLNADWLQGTTLAILLRDRGHSGPAQFLSWGGMLFDLFIVPALLWRRTRIAAFVVAVGFHLHNVWVFGLATFPWFSILMSSMFFGDSWPRKIPFFEKLLVTEKGPEKFHLSRILAFALGAYVLVHLTLPLRHLAYPGNPLWTEQGHYFSWRMMLRDKKGTIRFWVDKKEVILQDHLVQKQIGALVGRPEYILMFAHYLAEKNPGAVVKASSIVRLNGRRGMEMIRRGTDLAKEERKFAHYDWILRPSEVKEKLAADFLSAID